MDPNLIDDWLDQLLTLSSHDQAGAIMLAAMKCEPLARAWCAKERLADAHQVYLEAFARWQTGAISDADLEKAARPLDRRLNREIENEPDVVGAMAAHCLTDVEAIALGFSSEMIDEILRTALFFAAAAFTGSQDVPIEVDSDRLRPDEIRFIADWWAECVQAYPQLGQM